MKDLKNILTLNEKLIGQYPSKTILTDKRLIYLKGGINTHYKDISLSSIDSVEFTKQRHIWVVGAGFFVFLTSLVLAFFLRDYIISALGTGIVIFLLSILGFLFVADKEVIIYANNSKMSIKKVDMDFIKELRYACFKNN